MCMPDKDTWWCCMNLDGVLPCAGRQGMVPRRCDGVAYILAWEV